jgi:hypothetical protein
MAVTLSWGETNRKTFMARVGEENGSITMAEVDTI